MDLQKIAADVPDYQAFLTVDELKASSHDLRERFPDLVSIKEVGRTRNGDPIELISISGGDQNAFVFRRPPPQ